MTLLTTEILPSPFDAIVFAADRRISISGRRHSEQLKLHAVPGQHAGIGFYGLAEVDELGRTRRRMTDWLKDSLAKQSSAAPQSTLQTVAETLASELNRAVPEAHKSRVSSGFHLAGFQDGRPEFWFIRNLDDEMRITGKYESREDYQRRDKPRLPIGAVMGYRNGDIRAHISAWEAIDLGFAGLLAHDDFKAIRGADRYGEWVRFKMETLAHFYQRFCKQSVIGKPIDALVVSAVGVRALPITGRIRKGAG